MTIRNFILFFLGLLVFSSCKEVVIKVDSIPENTPVGQSIYIAGNFNNWDPGDDYFIMQMSADSNYYYTLPPGFGPVYLKFTRGDWKTVEKNICGEEIRNRSFETALNDTVVYQIESWGDLDPLNCPKLTLKVTNLPKNTPPEDVIAIAGSYNSWNPDDASVFNKTDNGDLILTMQRPPGVKKIAYKITRGDISNCESDSYGNDIPNRELVFGSLDTVEIDIEGWTDIRSNISKSNNVVILIDDLPANANYRNGLYLACNLNSWSPGNRKYKFNQNAEGNWYYELPRRDMILEFKVTRGDWSSVETDRGGNDIMNRSIDLATEDTAYVRIRSWKDIYVTHDNDITIILEKIPVSTPENAKIYISGEFSGWDAGKLRYRFRQNDKGQYYINMPREKRILEFKITRGSWSSADVGHLGIGNPMYKYNYDDYDTIYITVENWSDKPIMKLDSVTIMIDSFPDYTSTNDILYLASNFNDWNPGDDNFIFKKLTNGKYAITIPVKEQFLEYKITRGDWRSVEVDKEFQDINDRQLVIGFTDTININVRNWLDYR